MSSATGIEVEIENEGALRAANEIETGVPPAVGYENIHTMNTYMNKWPASGAATSSTTRRSK